ncbi:tail protein X [Cetobacterium sp.]|uniref:tail protein X n=1 Tax=Cetobacterium sp. TaxID=2071632 RepID=UPI003EE5333F
MKKYETVSGDTWDLISIKVYGNEKHMKELQLANRELSKIVIFESGIWIITPELQAEQGEGLPPWAE